MADLDLLHRAAQRAASRRFFLASALVAYAQAHDLDDAALAQHLGCDPSDLPLLLLCRRPAGEAAAFRADVQRIAARFGLDAARLAEAIRLAEALEALGKGDLVADPGLMAAARDRETQDGAEG